MVPPVAAAPCSCPRSEQASLRFLSLPSLRSERSRLEDQTGTVEPYDVETLRYAVRIHSSGERARVLEWCLRTARLWSQTWI